jgi:transposase
MPAVYFFSLRTRVVAAYNDGEGNYKELAKRFKVGTASVNRWLQRDRQGELAPTSRRVPLLGQRKLTQEALDLLRETLEDIPDSLQSELTQMLADELDIVVSRAVSLRSTHLARLANALKLGLSPGCRLQFEHSIDGPVVQLGQYTSVADHLTRRQLS